MRTAIAEHYDDLVSLAYTGIDEQKPWQGFVECLSEAAGLRDASITLSAVNHGDGGLVITSDRAPHLTRDYFQEVLTTDFMRLFDGVEIARPSSLDDLVSKRRWLASDLYKRFLKPFNIHRVLLTDVWRDSLLRVRLCVERSQNQEEFSDDERVLLERLSRHLAKGMDLRASLRHVHASSSFYQDAMDQLGICALFLNAAGQLVHANRAGEQLLERRGGLLLRDGKPLAQSACRNADQFRALLGGLLASTSQVPQGMSLLDDRGGVLLEILGRRLPVKGPVETKAPVLVLLVTPCRAESREPSAHLLRDIYGFTACEARLARLLVQGYSTQEAADLLQVSINTVKTHLKGIFDKMGYNKQSQVVIALSNSALKFV